MMVLARLLATMTLAIGRPVEGDAPVCPQEPSICGFVEGATRYYRSEIDRLVTVVVHDDAEAAALFVAAAIGITIE